MIVRLAISGALAACVGALTYFKLLRPHVLNFGATKEEIERSMPGDEILPAAALVTTRAITIDAPAANVWPWLVQMGPKPRAGAYTYDWVERQLGIDIENADRILTEYQQMDVGEFLPINTSGRGLLVREVHPNQSLVLQWKPEESTWVFALYSLADGTTRLVSRNRLPGSGPVFWFGMVLFMEAGSLVMERKMLQGIKRRAEGLARAIPAAA